MTKLTTKTTKPVAAVVTPKSRKNVKSQDSCCCAVFRLILSIFALFGGAGIAMYRWNLVPSFIYAEKGGQSVMSKLANDFSTTLCQQYQVSLGSKANAYLLGNGVHIDPNHRQVLSLTEQQYIDRYQYHYYPTHLLKDSHIQIRGCRLSNYYSKAEILVIKGDDKWKDWTKGNCVDCVVKSVDIDEIDKCIWHEDFDLEYYTTDEDNYYIVTTYKPKHPSTMGTYLFTRLQLVKTVYDFSDIRETCLNKNECTFNLTYASSEDILVRYPDRGHDFGYYVSVNTVCKVRVMFMVGIFAIIPIGLVLVGTLAVVCCACLGNASAKRKRKEEIKKSLLENQPSPVIVPPSYENAIADPPSYQAIA